MKKNEVVRATMTVTIAELIVCALTAGVYALIGLFAESVVFSYRVVTGALLGAAVVILNFYLLARSTNRAFDEALAERGEGEMTDEEAADFTEKYKLKMQGVIMKSQLLRLGMMAAALVAAFLLPVFDGVAAIVPMLAFRPVLMLTELIRKKEENGQS